MTYLLYKAVRVRANSPFATSGNQKKITKTFKFLFCKILQNKWHNAKEVSFEL